MAGLKGKKGEHPDQKRPGNIPELNAFGNALERYREALKWSQRELANRLKSKTDISPTAVNNWFRGIHLPTEENIIDIAQVIHEEARGKELYKDRYSTLYGSNLRVITINLWRKAGFSTNESPEDVIWDRIADNRENDSKPVVVTVGWAACPPFASTVPGERLSLEIADTVLDLMGATMEPRRYEWADLGIALHAQQIDLVAPILATSHHHLKYLQYSDSIGLMMRHVCIVPREAQALLSREGKDYRVKDLSEFLLLQTGQGVSEMFAKKDASKGIQVEQSNFEEAVKKLQEEWAPGRLPPCLVTASPTANEILKGKPKLIAARLPVEKDLPLSLAFGIPHNEPRLRTAINTFLAMMKRSGLLTALVQQYEARVEDMLVEDDVSELQTVPEWSKFNKKRSDIMNKLFELVNQSLKHSYEV
jgi:transcriptional regulator with XRE-family HTH domain